MCFKKILISKKFMEKGGGSKKGVSRFSVEIFLSTVSKNFLGGCLSASFISGIEKCQV